MCTLKTVLFGIVLRQWLVDLIGLRCALGFGISNLKIQSQLDETLCSSRLEQSNHLDINERCLITLREIGTIIISGNRFDYGRHRSFYDSNDGKLLTDMSAGIL